MGEKVDKVKKHFIDNKKLYIGVGVGVAVTTTVVIICRGVPPVITTNVQKGYTLTGDVTQTINQVIEVGMSRPGQKAFVIKCVESQKVWPSISAAAKDLGLSASAIGSHIKGTHPDVSGFHFEKLAEV
jgi:hypothetical protein